MQTMLMNFGDNNRVVYNVRNKAVTVGIGQSKKVDLDPATVKFIRKHQAADTLMVVPMDAQMPVELVELMSIIENLGTAEYDGLLERMVALIGKENIPVLRPTRHQMRMVLRNIAAEFAQDKAHTLGEAIEMQKKRIQDDVDPQELEQERQEQEKEVPENLPKPPGKVPAKDQMDAALGIASGNEGAVLAQEAEETDVDPPRTELEAQEGVELRAARAAMEQPTVPRRRARR